MKDTVLQWVISILAPFLPRKWRHGVVVLTYHDVAQRTSDLAITPAQFAQQLAWLRQNGYQSTSPFALTNHAVQRRVLITFDDGFASLLTHADPLLQKYGFQGTVFISTDYLGRQTLFCRDIDDQQQPMLSNRDVLELEKRGWLIGNHFASHRDLDMLSSHAVVADFQRAREHLQGIGVTHRNMLNVVSYPHGRKSPAVITALKNAGVIMAFSGGECMHTYSDSRYAISRVTVAPTMDMRKFAMIMNPAYHCLKAYLKPWLCRIQHWTRSPYTYALIILAALHVGMVLFAVYDVPRTGVAELGAAWWTHHGGDETSYFQAAQALQQWEFIPRSSPLGFSVLLIPFIIFFNAHDITDIARPVVYFNTAVFYSLAIVLVYWLTRVILVRRRFAIVAAALFTIYPYIFYVLFSNFASSSEVIREFLVSRFKQLMFISLHSDPLSTVLMYGSLLWFLLFMRRLPRWRSEIGWLGVLTSAAVFTRLQNAVILPLYIGILAWHRRWRDIALFTIGTAPLLIFIIYANWASNGSALQTAYELHKGPQGDISMISWEYPLRLIIYPLTYSPLLIALMIGAICVIIAGVFYTKKMNTNAAYIAGVYLLANTVPILFLEPTLRNPRYFLPVVPVVIIFALAGLYILLIRLPLYLWKKRA